MRFGIQSCMSKTNVQETTYCPSRAELRYPKRKRAQVAYHEMDDEEFLLGEEAEAEEDEEEYGPTKKVCRYRGVHVSNYY
jgi:hypothetical protein